MIYVTLAVIVIVFIFLFALSSRKEEVYNPVDTIEEKRAQVEKELKEAEDAQYP